MSNLTAKYGAIMCNTMRSFARVWHTGVSVCTVPGVLGMR